VATHPFGGLDPLIVLFNGNLLVGKAYTSQLELKPGDAF
jgi:hypothetical protein